jgi:elongation factor 3
MPSVEAMSATKPTGGKVASENAQSIKVLDELMSKLSVSKSQDETNAAARNLATFINGPIEEADAPTK